MRSRITRTLAVVSTLALVAALGPAGTAQAVEGRGRVARFRPVTGLVKVVNKATGDVYRAKITDGTTIKLREDDGTRVKGDIDDVVFGGRILRASFDGDELESVVFDETESGETDCSVDYSIDEDGQDESWDCTFGFETATRDESQSVSFDASSDAYGGGGSSDVSWDLSSDSTIGDDVDVSYDCSFDASADHYADAWGGDMSADTSFDCSWDGTEKALEYTFVPSKMAWSVTNAETGETFGCRFNAETVGWDCQVDLTPDLLEDAPAPDGMTCYADGGGSYSCDYSYDGESGDCSFDSSMDVSKEADGGSLSGDLSFDCSYDS